MKKHSEKTLERLNAALQAAYVPKFRFESCYADDDAKRNLSGRTYHVDEGTLKYFQSKILSGKRAQNDLLYWLVESVQSRPNHGGYTRRAVVFDVFGDIVNEIPNRGDNGEWFKDTAKAEKSATEFLAGFDAVTHTLTKLKEKAKWEIDQQKRVLAALSGKTIK